MHWRSRSRPRSDGAVVAARRHRDGLRAAAFGQSAEYVQSAIKRHSRCPAIECHDGLPAGARDLALPANSCPETCRDEWTALGQPVVAPLEFLNLLI